MNQANILKTAEQSGFIVKHWPTGWVIYAPIGSDGITITNELIRFAELVAQREKEALLAWAVSKWEDEVLNRPLINVHRRTLDGTWRQMIKHCGGDALALIGPSHDDLVEAERERGTK